MAVRHPALLCTFFALIEGTLAASLLLACAFAYHFVFRATPAADFAWHLYLFVALVLGVLYGLSAAAAAARFLAGVRRPTATVPFSVLSWTIAFAATLMIAFLSGVIGDLSRLSLTLAFVLGIPFVASLRIYVQSVLSRRIAQGELRFQKIAVVGERVDVLSFLLASDPWRHGHVLAGTLYLEDATEDGRILPERLAAFAAQAWRQGARYLVIAGDVTRLGEIGSLTAPFRRFALNVVYAPAVAGERFNFLDVVQIGANTTLRMLREPLSTPEVIAKRSLDLFGAGLGLMLLSPLLLLIALAIKLDSKGPVLYRQARRGFNGESFMIFKFRSMSVMETGETMRQASRNDARITRVGRILRATSLDELPQLINVLSGEMSLVGPRPHALSHDDVLATQVADYAHRQRIKPGITGWAQVNGYRGETTTLEQVQGRILCDLYYIDNWSIFLDLWVLLLTVVSPKTRRNAF